MYISNEVYYRTFISGIFSFFPLETGTVTPKVAFETNCQIKGIQDGRQMQHTVSPPTDYVYFLAGGHQNSKRLLSRSFMTAEQRGEVSTMRDLRLPPRDRLELRSSGLLHSEYW